MATKNKQEEFNPSEQMDLINETYVDGTLSIGVRHNVAKIDFYQAMPILNEDDVEEQREMRKASHRLVLPVTGLVEMHGILEKVISSIKEKSAEDKK
ncbi:MAG: hypothetical protein PSN36_00630 [Gammaproteobacteria bacterium]|nr:hypothetical protein [Gammaproteobacteria bacterium]